jgi:hypothetical protein
MPFAEASIVEWLRITSSLHHSRFEACGLPAGGNVRRGIATAWSGIMSVTNALDLNRLPSQELAQQAQDSPTNTGAALAVPTSALPQDQFTPSSSIESADTTAQAAGIFSAPKTSALPSSGASLVQPPTNSSATVALPSRTSTQAAEEALARTHRARMQKALLVRRTRRDRLLHPRQPQLRLRRAALRSRRNSMRSTTRSLRLGSAPPTFGKSIGSQA